MSNAPKGRRARRGGSGQDTPLVKAARAHLAGDRASAERYYRQALQQNPQASEVRYYLGALLIELDRADEADPVLEPAARAGATDPALLANLATARRSRRNWAGTREAADAVLAQQPAHRVARYNRALAARMERDYDQARTDLDALLAAGSTEPEVQLERGLIALVDQDPESAAHYLQASRAQRPDHAGTALNLAIAYNHLGYPSDALALLQGMATRGEVPGDWHREVAAALEALGALDEADDHLDKAVAEGCGPIKHFRTLGSRYRKQGALARAEAVLRRGIDSFARMPDSGPVTATDRADLNNYLGDVLRELGRPMDAQAAFAEAVAIDPTLETAETNRLLILHYDPTQTAASLFAAHRAWQQRFAAELEAAAQPPPAAPPGHRPLRVGILAAKLRRGPALLLYLPALENLDPAKIELIVYDLGSNQDGVSERLRRRCTAWHEIADEDQADTAARMRSDGLDILINKMGHAEGRLGICARKPAPAMAQWGGFNTTALDGMDAFLGDPVETPPGCEPYFTETIYRLPNDYAVFLPPPAQAPQPSPLPLQHRSAVTFGCLNNPVKLNAEIAAVWARLLAELPDSRLILKGSVFDDPEGREPLLATLEAAGLPRDRLVLYGWSDHYANLATYHEIDIALDSWPYSGGLTTCEALWMGVPVVTCPGPAFTGRHAASHLTAAGLGDWVAADWAGYVAQALRWARAPEALARLRSSLREAVRASPLCDGPRAARNLETALVELADRAPRPADREADG